MDHLRHEIDEIDEEIMNLMSKRMAFSDSIGQYKKRNNIAVLQTDRWNEILDRAVSKGKAQDLSPNFVEALLKAVHQESINRQVAIMDDKKTEA